MNAQATPVIHWFAMSVSKARLDKLLSEIQAEFPRFRIIIKNTSRFHRAIHYGLMVITFGGMRSYIDSYDTTMGSRLYVTDDWPDRDPDEVYITLCHERVHMRQFRRYTFVGMSLLYLLFPLPMGLAYCRARFEREAYEETIRASIEVHGLDYVKRDSFRDYILRQFTGPSYGWMWPFRRKLERWYTSVLDREQ